MAYHYGPRVVREGLVMYIDPADKNSYTGSGINVNDLSGSGNDATLVGNVSFSEEGKGSLVFDGSGTRGVFDLPITPSNPYSVIQWIKPNVELPNVVSSGSRKTPLVGDGPIWNFGYWLTAKIFRVHANTEYRDINIDWVGDTGWHQVGQLYNGSTCYAVIDGQVMLGIRTGYSPPIPSKIHIGMEKTVTGGTDWLGNTGLIQIYDRVLTEAEVLQNYNAIKSRYGRN